VPYIHQVSLGYQRQLGPQLSTAIDFIQSWTRDQLITFNLNPATRATTARTGSLSYTDLYGIAGQLGISPFRNQVLTRQNLGEGRYSGLNFQLEKRMSNNWSSRISYALAAASSNFENGNQTDTNPFQLLDDPRLDLNEGPNGFVRRHNFVFSGRVQVPRTGGLTASGTYRWMSGTGITIHDTTYDVDRNGQLYDPLPAGEYCGAGQNSICVDNVGGRNGARGPNFQQTDMRFGWRLRPFGETTLDVYFEVFNIFNETNWSNPNADQRSTDFLVLTSLFGANGYPRQGQFGFRFGF
jgi:hypothetical protein